MRVRAKVIGDLKYVGYYDHKRRKPGDIFTLVPLTKTQVDGKKIVIPVEKQFSHKWMEKVDETKPIEQKPVEPPIVDAIVQTDEVL